MNNEQENSGSTRETPSFFALPPALRYMSRTLFWGGVLFGMGWGIFLTLLLFALEAIKLDQNRLDPWLGALTLASVLIGQSIAQRAVRASKQAKPDDGDHQIE